MFRPGVIVTAKSFGKGTIKRIIGNKAIVVLEQIKIPIEFSLDELSLVSNTDEINIDKSILCESTENYRKNDDSNKRMLDLKTIESLRYGLVPEYRIKELTIGYVQIERWINRSIKHCLEGNPFACEVSGPYGTGKSHTLSVIRNIAHNEGFLIAKIEIDGCNVSFSNPSAMLQAICASINDNRLDADAPLVSLLDKVLVNSGVPHRIGTYNEDDRVRHNMLQVDYVKHEGLLETFSPLIEAVLSGSDEITAKELNRYIVSETHKLHGIDFVSMRSKDRDRKFRDLVEALVGYASLARMAGFSGLIITIDEFEIEYNVKRNASNISETLTALELYLRGNSRFQQSPLGIVIGCVALEGNDSDLIKYYFSTASKNSYQLEPISLIDLFELLRKIHEFYINSYDIKDIFDETLIKELEDKITETVSTEDESGLIRRYLKWYIALLDKRYGPPMR